MTITDLNKPGRYPLDHGYDLRPGNTPTALIVHTTNGRLGSSFDAESAFLLNSADVSAHYLVGKQGQIVRFMDEARYRAWHSGRCTRGFDNSYSIGVECHLTPGEAWAIEQHAALNALVRDLMGRYAIAEAWVETHRKVALPSGRKTDPCSWPDGAFYAWRDQLVDEKRLLVWRIVVQRANIRAAPTTAAPIVARYERDHQISVERAVPGEVVAGNGTWYKLQGQEAYVWGNLVRQL